MSKKRAFILLSSFSLLVIFWMISYQHHKTLLYTSLSFFISNFHGNNTNLTCCNKSLNNDISHFVSFHESIKDGRRLGNQLFSLAAVLFVAESLTENPT